MGLSLPGMRLLYGESNLLTVPPPGVVGKAAFLVTPRVFKRSSSHGERVLSTPDDSALCSFSNVLVHIVLSVGPFVCFLSTCLALGSAGRCKPDARTPPLAFRPF